MPFVNPMLFGSSTEALGTFNFSGVTWAGFLDTGHYDPQTGGEISDPENLLGAFVDASANYKYIPIDGGTGDYRFTIKSNDYTIGAGNYNIYLIAYKNANFSQTPILSDPEVTIITTLYSSSTKQTTGTGTVTYSGGANIDAIGIYFQRTDASGGSVTGTATFSVEKIA